MISPVDINTAQLRLVYDILHKHLPANTRVWAFGSRVKWETIDASDLDLAVESHKPIDHKTMSALNLAFNNSDLPYTIDIVDLKAVSNQFKKIIDEQKVLLVTVNSKFTNNQWSEIRLGDFAPFLYGKSLPTTKRDSSGNIPVVGSGGVIGYHNVGLTTGHTIVIGRKGTVGAVYYFPGPCWPIDTTFYVSGTDPLLMRFKYYVLQTLGLEQMNFDSAVPGLNRTAAHAKLLFVPDEQEQKNIAYILGTLDTKIDLNHKMNRVLEDIARTLFKSWFVDFDPVRAKMDGHWKQGKSLSGMPAHLYDLFPDTLVDSELGEIPKGWDIRSLDMIANFQNGLALQNFRPNTNEDRLPVVKIAQLRKGYVDNKEWAKESISSKCIIDDGDVIFSWSASLLVKIWCGGRAALNQHLFKVTSLSYPKWLYLSYIEHYLQKFRNIASGKTTSMGHIQRHHLTEAKCVIPDNVFINSVDDVFNNILTKKIFNDIESRSLVVLRNTLLSKLLSGELQTIKNNKKWT